MNAAAAMHARALGTVLGGLADVPGELMVSDITQDSRTVTPGCAFLACRGRTHHGLEFARSAAAAGARAILWESAPQAAPPQLDDTVLVREIPQLHAHLGEIADRFFGAPSARLTIAGITGTNGKTTCAWLLAQALGLLGRRTAYLGTLGSGMPGALQALTHTTPDAITLHRELARLRSQGADSVAMEVSSIALDQDRCAALRLHAAALTNLTRDHLDYHGDMHAYGEAKAKLFAWPALRARVINVDDRFGAALARRWQPAQPDTQPVGAAGGSAAARLFLTSQRSPEALAGDPVTAQLLAGGAQYVCARAVGAKRTGLRLTLATARGAARLDSALRGPFNVENLLTVLALLLAWDVPLADACDALGRCVAPPGRMQAEGGGALPLVLIDYAHTPDALDKALAAARAHCEGRLWCVFGCGGERDRGKRGEMGRVAALGADALIVTDDNPRGEDPEAIAAAIVQGIAAAGGAARAQVIHDRAAAIGTALAQAVAGDVVLVAGKGHEDYQIIGREHRPFSDAACARTLLARRLE
ncbi:MAG TPA: UDP-N-acetylmuramoyl-L-alanyl-D-glutamate--2,6-diaminopimelate ligase [Steroidobacteraceae bacterium]|jgi:UDP-N-acetylmuramoyl-L-alanyl-D-glutamate--2,6-diaminopimelate ligase|nr:UDP-N-acetylmuramoyl-L-alanyl-D-glutamate--2,6-diaminopimelate ligase [Steroidobacteraceae bacterium]